MRETQRHKDAFEYWLSLGGQASEKCFSELSPKFQSTTRTIWNWYNAFNWANRRDIRLNARAKKLEAKVDSNVVDRKAKELAQIADIKAIALGTIKATVDPDKAGLERLKVKINSAKDLATVMNAYKEMVKIEQLLIGEDTERSNVDTDALSDYIQKVLDREKGE